MQVVGDPNHAVSVSETLLGGFKHVICQAIDDAINMFYLVGGLEHEFHFHIQLGNVIIPSDELIFFRRDSAQPPTISIDYP